MRGNPIGFRVQRLNHSATVTPAPPSAALRLEPPHPQRDSAGPPFPPYPPRGSSGPLGAERRDARGRREAPGGCAQGARQGAS